MKFFLILATIINLSTSFAGDFSKDKCSVTVDFQKGKLHLSNNITEDSDIVNKNCLDLAKENIDGVNVDSFKFDGVIVDYTYPMQNDSIQEN